ncbi:MAG: Dihydrofolate reductase [Candidatus Gottesmanbacteria bacterium GW2011_GWA2_44_17]|uniref:Dihydrofolate reductase n=1 Tax=Candidatus Gottesmanbacteria bacterium GW2011_GWA2_44_17 TaxID=1618444 RepID=A0A0G1HG07_9BACT|nr:MAG: Dihydrofolate reductase [Candidatus Gottesmanbacteria bacterium GW2011_GWA2_44_17]
MVSIIVALDDKLGIGAKNRMLWHLKKDFAHFKAVTMNHPIIMGRKTHESIGRALPGRTNIVITRDKNYSTPGCHVVNSLEAALKTAKAEAGEIFIIGGGEIFKQALEQNVVDKLYVTKVKGDFNAEIFFPEYEAIFTKVLTSRSDLEGDYQLEFLELER